MTNKRLKILNDIIQVEKLLNDEENRCIADMDEQGHFSVPVYLASALTIIKGIKHDFVSLKIEKIESTFNVTNPHFKKRRKKNANDNM